MKAFGYKNLEEYRQAVKSVIHIEPVDFMETAQNKTTLLITADADITVPTAYQLELLDILKPKIHLTLKGNHFDAIKSSFFRHRADVVAFFKNYFAENP